MPKCTITLRPALPPIPSQPRFPSTSPALRERTRRAAARVRVRPSGTDHRGPVSIPPPPVHMHPVMPVPRELARPRGNKRQHCAGPALQPAGRDQGSRPLLRRNPPRHRPQHRRRKARRVRKKHRRGAKIGLANVPVAEHAAARLEHPTRLGAPQSFAGAGMPRAIDLDPDAPHARHRQRDLQHNFSNPRPQVSEDIICTQPRGSDKLAHPGRGQLAIHPRPGRPQLASIRSGAARAKPRDAVVEPLDRHATPTRPRRRALSLKAITSVAQSTLAAATRTLIHQTMQGGKAQRIPPSFPR
jgi:hypothetical protein